MFDTKIKYEQKIYTFKLCKKCNFGRRGIFDGDFERQYTGILGQVVMADALDLPRPDGSEGFDNGIDFIIFGKNIDLKTMGRTVNVKNYYVNNLVVSQTKYETDIYVFSSINKTNSVMTVIGLIEKTNLNKYLIKKGQSRRRSDDTTFTVKTDMYEIPNSDLTPVNDWLDLTWAIQKTNILAC